MLSLFKQLNWQKDGYLILLIIVSFSVYICGLWWGLPTLHDWSIDAITPESILFKDVWDKTYPPFHRYLLSLVYSPFFLLKRIGLLDLENIWVYTILVSIGRLVSVAMSIGIVVCTYITSREVFHNRKRPAFITALIATLIMPLVYYAKTLNLEAPYIFWFCLSVLFYIRILKYHRQLDYNLFAITAILSICTKDQAYGLYILTSLTLVLDHLKTYRSEPTIHIKIYLFIRDILSPILIGTLLFLAIHNVIFDLNGFIEHLNNLSDSSYSANSLIRSPENSLDEHYALFLKIVRETAICLGWPTFAISLMGFFFTIFIRQRNRLLLSLIIPAVSYYIFFLGVILYSRERFLIPVSLILSYFGGYFLDFIFSKISISWIPKIIAIGIISYSFFYAFSINILMLQDGRYVTENWLKSNLEVNSSLGFIGAKTYHPRIYLLPIREIKKIEIDDVKNCLIIRDLDYILTTSSFDIRRFPAESPEYKYFSDLYAGHTAYREVFRYQANPRWNLVHAEKFNPQEYYDKRFKTGNLNKINPEIRVFARNKNNFCSLNVP